MHNMVLLNTSPLQYLHQIGVFDLIRQLYGKIYIPEEVVQEIDDGRKDGVELPDIRQLYFANILQPKMNTLSRLVRDLGKGETAVILQALENPASLVVLDDLLARRVARELGIKITGTAGILINGKRKGFIEAIGPLLGKLEHVGFYLAPAHRSLILKKAGELKD